MDDFYSEMKSTLEELEDLRPSNFAAKEDSSTGVLQTAFPSMFAKAIVPANPRHWPAFTAGSTFTSDMPELGDKLKTPLNNLKVVKEYLETSQNDVQWRDRVWKVAEDTTTINMSCEFGKEPGAFGAGALSNKMADTYMDEMVETSLTLTNREKLNTKIFQQVAQDQGLDLASIRGTGVTRELVPEFMKGDLCDRPERNARPFDDDYSQGPLEDGIILKSGDDNFGTLGESIFESSSCENQKNLLDRFFDLFGGGGDGSMCPAPAETGYGDPESNLMKKFFDIFIPEGGGVYHCTDPSKLVPPSPFLIDMGGDFCLLAVSTHSHKTFQFHSSASKSIFQIICVEEN